MSAPGSRRRCVRTLKPCVDRSSISTVTPLAPRCLRPASSETLVRLARRSRAGTRVVSSPVRPAIRSEEHTSELQSLMRISYAVFCLKKEKRIDANTGLLQQDNQQQHTSRQYE